MGFGSKKRNSIMDDKSNPEVIEMDKKSKKKGDKKDKDEKVDNKPLIPPVPYFSLFRYATNTDRILLFVGFLAALAAGAALPLMIVIFGNMTQSMVDQGSASQDVYCGRTPAPDTTTVDPLEIDRQLRIDLVDNLKTLTIQMVIVGLSAFLLNYIFMFTFNYVSEQVVHRIRSRYLKAMLRQNVGWYDTNQDKNFVSRIADDLVKIADAIGEKVPLTIFFSATTIASLITAFFHGWLLTLVVLSSAPVLGIVTGAVTGLMSKLSSVEQQAYAKAGNVAEEAITNVKTVMAFGGAEKEIARYQVGLEFAKAAGKKRALFSGLSMGVMWFVMYCSYALAFWYGTKLIIEGLDDACEGIESKYSADKLLIVFFCVMMGAFNMGQSASYFEAFSSGRGAGAVIYSVIDRKPEIDSYSQKGKKPSPRSSGKISFENIKFSYPSRPDVSIMKNFSLDVQPGQTVALVGHSGCGKSTCIQLIQRFYDPLGGSVRVDDIDIKDLHIGWLRSQIGVVSQEPILFNTTIAENIRYGREGVTLEEIEEACRKSNAHTFISKLPLRYDTQVGDRGAQLSGGQKQRIAIARALVRNPPILLLDEATSALDTQSESIVQNALDRAREGRTTLIVAHRLSTIRAADLVVAISDGEVFEKGTHMELLKAKGLYYQLVTAQMAGALGEELDEAEEEVIGIPKGTAARKASIISRPSLSLDDDDVAVIAPTVSEGKITDKELSKAAPLSRIMKLNAKEWPYIVVGVIMAAIQGLSFPAFSIIFGEYLKIFSLPNKEEMQDDADFYAILFLVLGVGAGLSMYFQIVTFSLAGEELTSRLRRLSFAAMLKQELGWFDDDSNNIGALCARLAGDAAGVQGATGVRVGAIVQSLVTLGASFGLAMYYLPKLGGVALAFAPINMVAAYFQGAMMAGSNILEKDAIENASKIAVQAVGNIRTVASLCKEQHFVKEYVSILKSTHQKVLKMSHIRGALFGLSQGTPFVAYGVVMYYGGILIRDENADYGRVLKVGQALIMGTMMVGQAMSFTPNYSRAKLSAARIIRLLDRKPKIDSSPEVGLKIRDAKGSVSIKDVAFNYPTRPEAKILRSLTMNVVPGTSVALVGPSGCGKSTIIQLILRYYDPITGTVRFEEQDIPALNVDSLRLQMAIVAQEPALFDRTIAENIAYGDNSRTVPLEDVINAAQQANIHKFIVSLPAGYETRVGEMGSQLSGGQKQRVAIARALVRNPKLLLLDEATSALDTESEAIVQEALDAASSGRTSITIAHRLSSIQQVDRILVINNGELLESGTHSELLEAKGLYHVLWNMQGQHKKNK